MTATNTPVEAPAGKKGFMSRIKEGADRIKEVAVWVKTKVYNFVGSAAVGTTALTGSLVVPATVGVTASAVTENAEGSTILLNWLPTSTVSVWPTLVEWSATNVTSSLWTYNSRLYSSIVVTNDTSIDRIYVTLSAADIGEGGTLTISGKLVAWTGGDLTWFGGTGFASTNFQVQQQAKFGLAWGPMITIASLDSWLRTNNTIAGFNSTERWLDNGFSDESSNNLFTYNMPITQSGTYHLDNVMTRMNSTGTAQFEWFNISYAANIPEPSTGLLAGWALWALLLRRRREDNNSQK